MTTILFVCSGNTCRSPMAEAIARDIAARPPFDAMDIHLRSAGAAAMDGAPATPEAVTAVEAMGMEMHDHRSAALTRRLIEEADVIYGLTPRARPGDRRHRALRTRPASNSSTRRDAPCPTPSAHRRPSTTRPPASSAPRSSTA